MATLVTNTEPLMKRRHALKTTIALLGGASLLAACQPEGGGASASPASVAQGTSASGAPTSALQAPGLVEVWKTPTCGCCKLWVEHLEKEGFTVKANDVPQTAPIRTKLGIPDDMGSCHTGLIAGFAVEGHVPAKEIRRLLAEPESLRQQVLGLSVPGMPAGSPGMEMGTKRDKFDVMLVLKNGQHRVYQTYSSIA